MQRPPPLPEKIEEGLTDGDFEFRVRWASRTDCTPTVEQVERALADEHWKVRREMARRTDIVLDDTQVEQGLADPHWRVRLAILERTDVELTKEQIGRALASHHWELRRAIVLRHDVSLGPDQIERCLKDRRLTVRLATIERPDVMLSPGQVDRALGDEFRIRAAVVERADLTPEQVDWVSKDEHWRVLAALAKREDIELNEQQLMRGVEHHIGHIRAAFIRRMDFSPTLEQIKAGVSDMDREARNAWNERLAEYVAREQAQAVQEIGGERRTRRKRRM